MAHARTGRTADRFSTAVVAKLKAGNWFRRHDGPTLLVALAIYASWLFLLSIHRYMPWYILAPLAGYVVQWHFSLQHEAIHSLRTLPEWLRRAIVWPPIGGWFPFELYRRSHTQHHRNNLLTVPGEDTETYYHREEDWEGSSPVWHWLLTINQTLLGRLLIGPILRIPRLYIREGRKMLHGDWSNLGIWCRHAGGVTLILLMASYGFGLPAWQYGLEFIYSATMFGMLRTFIEHRWGPRPSERTAIVESNWVFGNLFLWNNLHAVHHTFPALPWYYLPEVWHEHRQRIVAHNGGYVFKGYGEIARRWLVKPVFEPIFPPTREKWQGLPLSVGSDGQPVATARARSEITNRNRRA